MPYAEVAVNAPGGHRNYFSYAIPDGLMLQPGTAVWVPFGPRIHQGVVIRLSNRASVPDVRPVISVIGDRPALTSTQVELALWLANFYLSPLFDAIALFLPPGFERRSETLYTLDTTDFNFSDPSFTAEMQTIIRMIKEKGSLSLPAFCKVLEAKPAKKAVDSLIKLKILSQSQHLQTPRVKEKFTIFVRLKPKQGMSDGNDPIPSGKNTSQQARLITHLAASGQAVQVDDLLSSCHATRQTLNSLVSKGLVEIERTPVRRNPLALANFTASPVPILNPSQTAALSVITPSLDRCTAPDSKPSVYCLFGTTGSGKTEIYLRLLREAVNRGKRGICLVPEISLTPQAVERFHARFPGRVAVLHSHLSPGEQYDEWHLIQKGDFDVVVGPRSALFAPQSNLGLIVLDEEHEWTYKQTDKSPRYHSRTVAIELARSSGATLVLGSATPDVETFHAATTGIYQLVELPERVTPLGKAAIASIKIIDLRQELKSGNTGLFSSTLENAIRETIGRGEQVILFLNRRGSATMVACGACGHIERCRRCDSPLAYHAADQELHCHRCGHHRLAVRSCPECHKPRLRFLGIGTEAVEAEAIRLFPSAKLLRWDADSASGRHDHEKILSDFRDRRADILIGTQMLAKGLDLPGITLAGVICADTGLNIPDFRSSERTFQLLTQVAGRVGRGERPGNVLIQTYSPDHYAVKYAALQDYRKFYTQEIAWRRSMGYPPFRQLVRLTFSHTNPERCRTESINLARDLNATRDVKALSDIEIMGAQPAAIARLRGRWRWQITLAGKEPSQLLAGFNLPRGWSLDVDPIGVL